MSTVAAATPQQRTHARATAAASCGTPLEFQVMLDRLGFSPGEIDGAPGANLHRALTAYQKTRGLHATGRPDCETQKALQQDSSEPATRKYELTADDVKGPFSETIPSRLDEQGHLPALEYRSPLERIAERFHGAPALLQRLNGRSHFQAGDTITVPNVTPFDPIARPASDPSARDVSIVVSRNESALRATQSDGTLVFFAPVTSGSVHDPLPEGDWTVENVLWRPVFHYNPNLFWDADADSKAVAIKSGPNNPVGVVWIGLSLEHYGLHGTPEPSKVGRTQSHGCVRLTNWDAARLASLVKAGTQVSFR
jgi:lipoprotein-anchoring transpeptidase ErfK/SrfK